MNIKTIKNNDSDSAVARNVSNMMLNNYKKGLAISNNELAVENGISDSVGVVDPTETIRIGKSKVVSVGVPKGYKAKSINASEVPKLASNSSSQQAKEFILQSKALDNELDHVIAHMKLNNKEEFYDSGKNGGITNDVYKEIKRNEKMSIDENPEVKALNAQRDEVFDKLKEAKIKAREFIAENMEEDDTLENNVSFYEEELEELDRQMHILRDSLKHDIPPASEFINSLVKKGKIVDRTRVEGKGKQHILKNMDGEDYENMRTEEFTHLKSKKGLRITNTIGVEAFSQDLLLAIKKISNHLNAVLLPLAQKMYDTRFQGITLQDKNTVIPELYKEVDEKMYILTSLNNQSNTQLIKIDKDFDKLYSLVSNGLNMYVMPTGGSMNGGSIRGGNVQSTTNYLYEL